ncbi:MAG: ABC transporter ATP-binding protein, partial [Bacilli bacterium]|nr:ABC transporter ATP-binding protein [Bacilli bacterium]
MAETEVPRHLKLVVDGLNESTITAEMLWNTLGTILLLALGILVGRIVWRLLIFYASRKIEAGLRDDMFRKAERLPLTYFRENKVGAIM